MAYDDKVKVLVPSFTDRTFLFTVDEVVGVSGAGWGGTKDIPSNGVVDCDYELINGSSKTMVVDGVSYDEKAVTVTESTTLEDVQAQLQANEYAVIYTDAKIIFKTTDATKTIEEFTHPTHGQIMRAKLITDVITAWDDVYDALKLHWAAVAADPKSQILCISATLNDLTNNYPPAQYKIGKVGTTLYLSSGSAWSAVSGSGGSSNPTVTSVTPADEAQLVGTSDPITLVFDQRMDGFTLDTAATVTQEDETPIGISKVYETADATPVPIDSMRIEKLVIQPVTTWPEDIILVNLSTGAKAITGIPLASPFQSNFSTLPDQAPAAPDIANITVSSITKDGFTVQILTANQPTDPDDPEAVITFDVANNATGTVVATGITSAQLNSGYAVTAANTPGEAEDIFVRAVSSVSGEGAWSDAKSINIPDNAPTAPVISFVSKTDTAITIHLDTASTDDSGSVTYDVYKNDTLHAAGITFDGSSNYQLTGLNASTSYNIVAKAKDNASPTPHETASNTVTQTTNAEQFVPTLSSLDFTSVSTSGYTAECDYSDGNSDPCTGADWFISTTDYNVSTQQSDITTAFGSAGADYKRAITQQADIDAFTGAGLAVSGLILTLGTYYGYARAKDAYGTGVWVKSASFEVDVNRYDNFANLNNWTTVKSTNSVVTASGGVLEVSSPTDNDHAMAYLTAGVARTTPITLVAKVKIKTGAPTTSLFAQIHYMAQQTPTVQAAGSNLYPYCGFVLSWDAGSSSYIVRAITQNLGNPVTWTGTWSNNSWGNAEYKISINTWYVFKVTLSATGITFRLEQENGTLIFETTERAWTAITRTGGTSTNGVIASTLYPTIGEYANDAWRSALEVDYFDMV